MRFEKIWVQIILGTKIKKKSKLLEKLTVKQLNFENLCAREKLC